MRKLSSILVAVCMLAAGSVFANNLPSKEPEKKLSNLIENLLDDYVDYASEIQDDLTAVVKFIVNEHKEIVVLSVDTEDANLESFVKSRLNYEKADLEECKEGRMYTIPVRFNVLN